MPRTADSKLKKLVDAVKAARTKLKATETALKKYRLQKAKTTQVGKGRKSKVTRKTRGAKRGRKPAHKGMNVMPEM